MICSPQVSGDQNHKPLSVQLVGEGMQKQKLEALMRDILILDGPAQEMICRMVALEADKIRAQRPVLRLIVGGAATIGARASGASCKVQN